MSNESTGFDANFETNSTDDITDRRERLKKRPLLKFAEKQEAGSEEEEPKSLLDRLRKEKEKRRRQEAIASKKEKEPTPKEIEKAKKKVVREHIEEEVAELSVRIEATNPGSAEHTQAVAAKEFLEKVSERTAGNDTDIDPAIEVEYQKRMDKADRELAELNLLSQEDLDVLATLKEDAASTKKHDVTAARQAAQQSISPFFELLTTPNNRSSEIADPMSSQQPASRRNYRPFFSPPGQTAEKRAPRRSGRATADFLLGVVAGKEKRHGTARGENREPLDSALHNTVRHLKRRETDVKERAARGQTGKIEYLTHVRNLSETENRPGLPRVPAAEVMKRSVTGETFVTTTAARSMEALPRTKEQYAATSIAETEKQTEKIDLLPTPDILQIAEAFFIDGRSIRRLYETNQIDRSGLEKIIKTGLKGGDIKEAFENVELGRERQRERAREFRHDDPGFTAGIQASSQSSSILTPLPTPIKSNAPLTNQPNLASLEPLTPTPSTRAASFETSNTRPGLPFIASLRSYVGPLIILAFGLALVIMWLAV